MKRLIGRSPLPSVILVALCSVVFSSGDAIAQCFGGRCVSAVRVSSFRNGGLIGLFQQRRFERDIGNAIRTQNALNSLAFAQSFVVPQIIQQRFVIPTSFVVPSQVSYVQSAPAYAQSAPAYVQSAPQSAPQSDISRVTGQLRQLQEMSQALQALQRE